MLFFLLLICHILYLVMDFLFSLMHMFYQSYEGYVPCLAEPQQYANELHFLLWPLLLFSTWIHWSFYKRRIHFVWVSAEVLQGQRSKIEVVSSLLWMQRANCFVDILWIIYIMNYILWIKYILAEFQSKMTRFLHVNQWKAIIEFVGRKEKEKTGNIETYSKRRKNNSFVLLFYLMAYLN